MEQHASEAREPRLVHVATLAVAAALGPLATLAISVAAHLPGYGNDFSSYWLAGRLVAAGTSPYDLGALSELATREHVAFLLGTGYSYPPPFAVLMVPLASLPFGTAMIVFEALSIAVFAAAVAAWIHRLAGIVPSLPSGAGLRSAPGLATATRRPERALPLLLALAAGAYPPVIGSVYFGQVNLAVMGLLALGFWPLLDSGDRGVTAARGLAADVLLGVASGVAGIIKLVPLVLAGPLVLWSRFAAAIALVSSAAAALVASALIAPGASRQAGRLGTLLASDGFWSNQSINGFATRLVSPTDRTRPLFGGLADPAALGIALIAGLAIVTLAILWIGRPRANGPTATTIPVDVRLAIGFTLVAALAAAPKDSFWNHVPALLAVGLLLASLAVDARAAGGDRLPVRGLLAVWYATAWLQLGIDASQGAVTRALGAVGSVVSSTALIGLLALWGLIGAFILQRAVVRQTPPEGQFVPYSRP